MQLYIGGRNQGKYQLAKKQNPNCPIWNSFHCFVKESLEEGLSKDKILENVRTKIKQNPDIIIISDEVGNGIVPLERLERVYRDVVGEILQELASQADKVVRVTCGIAQQIK